MQNKESNGYKYILTAIDMFSKKAFARAMKSKEEKDIIKAMKQIMQNNPLMKSVRLDNGSEFISDTFRKLLKDKNIKQVFSQAGKPQSNGNVEKFNGTIGRMIDMQRQQGNMQWDEYLQELVSNYNNAVHDVTKQTPNELQVNETLKDDARNKIKQKTMIKNSNNDVMFQIGDIVRQN
jgi:transposase InsO family protein